MQSNKGTARIGLPSGKLLTAMQGACASWRCPLRPPSAAAARLCPAQAHHSIGEDAAKQINSCLSYAVVDSITPESVHPPPMPPLLFTFSLLAAAQAALTEPMLLNQSTKRIQNLYDANVSLVFKQYMTTKCMDNHKGI
jgi:hypothetical protein